MALDLTQFQSAAHVPGRKDPEIRNPKNGEPYFVLEGMVRKGVDVSDLGTKRPHLILPQLKRLIRAKDWKKLTLQGLALQEGCLLCIYDPERSPMRNALTQFPGRWVQQTYVHATREYDVKELAKQLSIPQMPFESIDELAEAAFADRIVVSQDHPALRDYLEGK